jgi:hypothetical protein
MKRVARLLIAAAIVVAGAAHGTAGAGTVVYSAPRALL